MTTRLSSDPRKIMAENVETLRDYARREILHGEALSLMEERDRAARVQEFLQLGTTLRCTKRELVAMLYKGIIENRRGFECPGCRSRAGSS